jgi:transcriptional regulator with XRE-family HTH domain
MRLIPQPAHFFVIFATSFSPKAGGNPVDNRGLGPAAPFFLGLSERRYGYYATGEREPNLATLVRICEVLAATPNDLLLQGGKPPAQSGRDRLLARISAATNNLSLTELELAACQIECLTATGPRGDSECKEGRRGDRLEIISKFARVLEVEPLGVLPARERARQTRSFFRPYCR